MHRVLVSVLVVAAASSVHAEGDWLSRGAKDWSPTVTRKTGIGTANAVAEGKVTRDDIQGWCENWSPGDAGCVAREMSNPDATKTYRATANCLAGTITPIDGNTYTLAGVWDASDIGEGRTKWKDASGAIVGRDNASGGLGISQQWEVLCPGPLRTTTAAAKPAPGAPAKPPAGAFAVGDVVEAKYGRDWVRGRIDKVRPGPEYDVRLDNGQRGILPPRMIRAVR